MSASPPTIITQPVNQFVSRSQTATLSVVATSPAPLSYQWYQGQSGDISTPIEGAVGSSFTTPALTTTISYWVQVSNVAGSANSNTATVTVIAAQPPTCTPSLQGAGSANPPTNNFATLFVVTANPNCIDPQGEALTTSVDWGDGTPKTPQNGGVFVATHTYRKLAPSYNVTVTSTDTSGLPGTAQNSLTLVPSSRAPAPVFQGQSTTVTVTLTPGEASPIGLQVQFECTTATDSGGTPHQASAVGIACNSIPATFTFNGNASGQSVTIEIHTSGGASGSLVPGMRGRTWFYALWLPLQAFIFLSVSLGVVRLGRGLVSKYLVLGILAALSVFTSCGGGFTAPKITQATPAGNYQVTVIDQPVLGQTSSSGFVQTSLIVPLSVSPFQ
jgi:hypothetical protein